MMLCVDKVGWPMLRGSLVVWVLARMLQDRLLLMMLVLLLVLLMLLVLLVLVLVLMLKRHLTLQTRLARVLRHATLMLDRMPDILRARAHLLTASRKPSAEASTTDTSQLRRVVQRSRGARRHGSRHHDRNFGQKTRRKGVWPSKRGARNVGWIGRLKRGSVRRAQQASRDDTRRLEGEDMCTFGVLRHRGGRQWSLVK